MLVLSRKRDEVICIGDNIRLMVIEIRGDKVRLGIDAPRTVSVHREEIYDAIRRENGVPELAKPAPEKTEFNSIAELIQHRKAQARPSARMGTSPGAGTVTDANESLASSGVKSGT